MTMTAATLFSGIGAPELAMPEWRWAWHAENEPFPAAVMAAHHPASVNLGDVTAHDFVARARQLGHPDVIVFGSPCQDFSIAGRRLGLDGPRGNLALIALGIIGELRPRWFVFENVPGLLSNWSGAAGCPTEPGCAIETTENSDFAAFLGCVDELGYSLCWAMLDAQHFGVAQRRERLFAVGYLGDWRGPAAVLVEPEGLRGDPPARGEARANVAGTLGTESQVGADDAAGMFVTLTPGDRGVSVDQACAGMVIPICESGKRAAIKDNPQNGMGIGDPGAPMFTLGADSRHAVAFGGNNTTGPIDVATACRAKGGSGHGDFESETFLCFDTTQITSGENRCRPEPGDPCHPLPAHGHAPAIAFTTKDHGQDAGALAPTLRAMTGHHANAGGQVAIAFDARQTDVLTYGAHTGPLDTGFPGPAIAQHATVRRLTPRECERLQGMPDDYTAITYRAKPAADGPRYKAIGNSMAVPVVRWILERIAIVDGIMGARQPSVAE